MKTKMFVLAAVFGAICGAANAEYVKLYTNNCDISSMRAELNRAVAAHHAVITSIVCEEPVAVAEPVEVESCGEPFARVINREYFVRETVQTYKPVVHYEPAGTYTTMRAVCGDSDC